MGRCGLLLSQESAIELGDTLSRWEFVAARDPQDALSSSALLLLLLRALPTTGWSLVAYSGYVSSSNKRYGARTVLLVGGDWGLLLLLPASGPTTGFATEELGLLGAPHQQQQQRPGSRLLWLWKRESLS